MLARLGSWLRITVLRRRLDREMQEEMRVHLDRAAERLVARGMSPEAARLAARREFGNVATLQEEARDIRGGRWIESTAADIRFGVRHLARTPFATATMVVLLALAIGFDTAMFSVLYSLTNMPPAAVTRDASLVRIRGIDRSVATGSSPGREISYPEYREYAAQSQVFDAVTAWSGTEVLIDVGQRQSNLQSGAATYVTDNYFRVLGVSLPIGVMPAAPPSEPSTAHLAAVISHALWERYFERAPDVLGRTVKVDDHAITIVGVAPPRFSGTAMGGSQLRLWLPLSARQVVRGGSALAFTNRDSTFLGVAARLRPGVSMEQALPSVHAIAARTTLELGTPKPAGTFAADLAPLLATNHAPPAAGEADGVGRYLLFGMMLLILLIPCTNVSALLVGRAAARRREIVVRLALGAARRRLVRQLLTESVLLAVAAAALGVWVIWILLRVFGSRIPDLQVALHWPVLGFAFGFAILVGVLFGISPSLHATRVGVSDVLKDSGAALSTRSRLQSGLVVAQIALAQPLLLMLGTLIMDMRSDLARRPASALGDRLVELRFRESPRGAEASREDALRQLAERLGSLPGVIGAVPQQDFAVNADVAVHPSDRVGDRGQQERLRLRLQPAPGGYFELLDIPLVRGRGFTRADEGDASAIVIGRDLARELWGSADPIGRRFVAADSQGGSGLVVVGVVDDQLAGLGGGERRVFAPIVRMTTQLLVRTEGPADALTARLRTFVASEAPGVSLTSVRTVAALEASERSTLARVVAAATSTGIIALLIGAIGLYAVVAFAVGQRAREIGIRTALGAGRGQVVRMFVYRGLRLSVIGLGLGLGLSIVVLRVSAAVRGAALPAGTPLLGAIIMGLVTGVALVATWLPARRAATVDPLSSLRTE